MTNRRAIRHGAAYRVAVLWVLCVLGLGLLPAGPAGAPSAAPSSASALPGSPGTPMSAAAPAPAGGSAAVAPGPHASASAPLSNVVVQLSAQPRRGIIPFTVSLTVTAHGSPLVSEYNLTWAFGDGSPVVTTNVSVSPGTTATASQNHLYTLVGTFYANVTVRDGVDANATASIGITSALPLLVTAQATPSTVTTGRPVSLTANASGGIAPYTYVWSGVPAGCAVTGANVTCVPRQVGNYSVQLQVTDSIPIQAFATAKFSVNPKLVASATFTSWYHCEGSVSYLTDNFSGTAKGGTAPYRFSWDPGDGSANLTGVNVTHNYTQATTLNVTLSITDASGAIANRTLSISTSFIACGGLPPYDTTGPTIIVGGTIAAGVAVAALVILYLRTPPGPPRKKRPLSPAPSAAAPADGSASEHARPPASSAPDGPSEPPPGS